MPCPVAISAISTPFWFFAAAHTRPSAHRSPGGR